MSKVFITTCPNCEKEIEIPYKDVMSDMGRRSVAKRNITSEYMRSINKKRYRDGHLHPKEQAILDLSRTEDLNKLTYKQIAQKVGITGLQAPNNAWRYAKHLEKRGLLTLKKRLIVRANETIHPRQQEIFALSRTQDILKLTYTQIADKIGVSGKYVKENIGYHIRQLQKKGLLPVRE